VFILEHAGEFIGLLVDRVLDIVEITREQIAPPPPNLKGLHAKYVSGVFRNEEMLVAILDTEQLLAGES
jgi:purine-binding chemotaxis protein CheW